MQCLDVAGLLLVENDTGVAFCKQPVHALHSSAPEMPPPGVQPNGQATSMPRLISNPIRRKLRPTGTQEQVDRHEKHVHEWGKYENGFKESRARERGYVLLCTTK